MRLARLLPATFLSSILLATTAAPAAITAFFVVNPITPAAITADPALANMRSWSVHVTCDGNWASAGLEAILPAGNTFYNPALGGNTKPSPAIVTAFPNIAFDTYVTSPGDHGSSGAPAILGFFPEAPGPGDFGGTSGRFSVSWGDLAVDAPGTYEILRLTFPIGVIPAIRMPPQSSPSQTSQVNPDSTTLIIVPEPAALGLVATAAGVLAVRCRPPRRRCA